MFFLCLINIYPNYYSWWSYFNYYNDDFYSQLHHQLFFSVTELAVTSLVLNLTNTNNQIISWKIYIIICINFAHILIGGLDQFVEQLIFGEGYNFLKARDIGLVLPDVLHIVICLWEIYSEASRMSLKINEIYQRKQLVLCVLFISAMFVIGQRL